MDIEKATELIQDLSMTFADTVFKVDKLADGTDVQIAMASLQGYLLKHKKRPRVAVEKAKAWVDDLWQIQNDKVLKKLERQRKKEEAAAGAPLTPTSPTSPGAPVTDA